MHKYLLLLAALCLTLGARADKLMDENFAYDAGDLYNAAGPWLQYAKQTEAPIQVGGTPLTYAGYQDNATGLAALLTNTASGQDLHYMFRTVGNAVNSGTLYASALINVADAKDEVYFLALVSDSKAGLKDGGSTSEYHRLFAKASTSEGKFLLGCSKNGASTQGDCVELNLGETYLVVMKWEFVEGTMNDVATVFVNPTHTEPATPTLQADANKADPSTANGLIAVELRQGSSFSKTGPTVSVDAIRVATTYDELFQAATPDVMTVQAEKLYTQEYAEVGQTLPYAQYTVTTNDLAADGTIYLTGTDADQYTVAPTTIPAGTGQTLVTVNYVPTRAGKHQARLNFEVSPAEWNQGATLFAMAIDPATPPTITYDASVLTAFSANVDAEQEQTLTLHTANLIDYGTIRFTNPSGHFGLSSSSLMKDGETTVTITFRPYQAGTFTDEIEVSGIGVAPTTFTVTGTTTSDRPAEEREGDDYVLTNDNPLALMNETFDAAVKNKPLAQAGWTNAALEGTRAWWGYTDDEGNGMAKVTPYDSKGTTTGEACQMLLVSPALAYNAAAEKLLTFRIKGQFLSDGQSDLLEVCYIDATGSEPYVEPIGGLSLPATSDFNDKWQDYTVDLTGLDLADPFHIGFRFTSTRGRSNSATYYVDDVTWGRADIPFIRPSRTQDELTAALGAQAEATYHIAGINLTAGITLKVTGPNASRFRLSSTTLPAEGGDVTVTFQPEEQGLHEAYIEMTSEGAPASQIVLLGHATTATGITQATTSAPRKVYDLTGRQVTSTPRRGIYIVDGKKQVVK